MLICIDPAKKKKERKEGWRMALNLFNQADKGIKKIKKLKKKKKENSPRSNFSTKKKRVYVAI